VLQPVAKFSKPRLLYGVERLDLMSSSIIKLTTAGNFALGEIFSARDTDIDFITLMCERYSFEDEVAK